MALKKKHVRKPNAPRARGRNSGLSRRTRGSGPAATRSRGDIVLAQGSGQVPRKPFGSKRTQQPDLRVWDAKLPHHLSLPRSVGPYITVRTTKRFEVTKDVNVFGTFKLPHGGDWTHLCYAAGNYGASAISSPGNTYYHAMPLSGLGSAATVVPSAFSVQLINSNAVGTTDGVVYAGRMSTQAAIAGDARSWHNYAEQFVEFMNPRVLMAGKLALRGVTVDSYPLNMNACSEFTPLSQDVGLNTLDANAASPTGWAPIMVYIPANEAAPDAAPTNPLKLEALVTTEWRVRFDLTNPASAGHVHHPISSDWTWEKLMRQAVALGNGVMDISDVVANTGQAIGQAQRAIRAARPMLALGI